MKNIHIFLASLVLSFAGVMPCFAEDGLEGLHVAPCSDLVVIFARGSGGEYGETAEYEAVVAAAQKITNEYNLGTYTFDLDYPAVDVSNVGRLVGAFVSAGKAYEFGESVRAGVRKLQIYALSHSADCPDDDYILVGYSQGAMVVAQALSVFVPARVKFVMLLGDPNTYLPEGEGLFPEACNGGVLSAYRTYAPNCRTYEGVFGGRKPYELPTFAGKYSLWCNREDYICGSSKNPLKNSGHTNYVSRIGWGMGYLAKQHLEKYIPSEIRPLSLRSVPLDNYLDDNLLVDDVGGADISAPDVMVWRDGDVLKMQWQAPNNAKDLLLKFNGIDLGYIDSSLGEFEIRDVDFLRDYDLSLAWMDESGELGAIAHVEPEVEPRIVVEAPDENKPQAAEPEPVATSSSESIVEVMEMSTVNNGIVTLPTKIVKKNGLSFADKSQIVTAVISMMGAGGLLTIFVVRKRRG